ncbi:serine/threonine-protein kinase [Nonomuraea sp. SBT364]|uniref:serine/threonine-protein kinase n=1 Tax=Nonomuraea sp. SBT364 TaxID=1580530 RepID=UPI00069CE0C9|nr:serine/threonine-protein kinase [Nonomuraea sp. SBT364]
MATDAILAGRYRLASRLGEGGMGIVWRAWDGLLGREVAVKEVRLPSAMSWAARRELCERTIREARAAGGLAHPSIITVHDVILEDDRPWIVMDLVAGPSLERLVEGGGRLPPDRVARIGLQLLDALGLAHRRGVLHRDVKPANVLLARDDLAILTDFGIAVRSGDTALTSADALVGSPGYMAPERIRNDGGAGPPSDLWSLAATLYAAVEGAGPFHRPHHLAALGAVLTEPAPPPRHAGPLGPALLAALAKDPLRRPTPDAFRHALEAAASPDGGGMAAGVSGPVSRARHSRGPVRIRRARMDGARRPPAFREADSSGAARRPGGGSYRLCARRRRPWPWAGRCCGRPPAARDPAPPPRPTRPAPRPAPQPARRPAPSLLTARGVVAL